MKNQKKIMAFFASCFAAFYFVNPTVAQSVEDDAEVNTQIELPFTDEASIPDFSREAIRFLYDENIMRGNRDGTFAADRNINRAEFAKLIIEATNTKKYVPLSSAFLDVGSDDWFFAYVETGRVLGWWGGYGNGLFKPGDYINRAEIAKILVEAFDLDVKEREGEGWYEKYFRTLSDHGLLAYGTTLENPGAGLTPSRAEVAEQIFRFVRYKSGDLDLSQDDSSDFDTETVELLEEEDSETDFHDLTPTPTDYTPPKTGKVNYNYIDTNALGQKIDSLAGKMYVEEIDPPFLKTYVSANQAKVNVLKLKFRSEGGILRLRAFQLKLSGNGTPQMFSRIWVQENDEILSEPLNPQKDVSTIYLKNELVLHDGESTTLTFYANIDVLVDSGDQLRVALFLPSWISANTNKKIGFFPFAGSDIIVK